MRIGIIYTKQIGNCLDNLVFAKQVPQFMKTLSKELEKESQFSPKVKYHTSHKIGKECHVKFYNHMIARHTMSMKCYQLNPIAGTSSERTIYVELSLKNFANFSSDVTYLPSRGQSDRFFRAFPITEPIGRLEHHTRGLP
jgi:hypothetical protein